MNYFRGSLTNLTFRALGPARERAFTRQNILSAFEATGISPLDPWRTAVMRDFRKRFRKSEVNSLAEHVDLGYTSHAAVAKNCADILDDKTANLETVRQALADALDLLRGAEARSVIAKQELKHLQTALKESKKTPGRRGGRVGHARVYEQREIEEIGLEKSSRKSKTSKSKTTKVATRTHQA